MNAKIYVAGHSGMVGSAIVRLLRKEGASNIIVRTHAALDLTDTAAVKNFFQEETPDHVFLAAATVGGIIANSRYPVEFLYNNLMIQNNIIRSSYDIGAKKLCFLGSSCIYPRECPQPIKEEYLLTGRLEPTNEGYALAKIAGLKLVEYYRREYAFKGVALMPCNLYGTNDSYDLEHSHVLSALVRKFVDACDQNSGSVTVWGSGNARREFMHVDDCARAALFVMRSYDGDTFLNTGWGSDVTIRELAEKMKRLTGFKGKIEWDTSKPDGMPRKCLDTSRMTGLGFAPAISLEEGITRTIDEYRKLKKDGRIKE
ncbi:MAG: GDP-L-fucose synthase [Spirochaetota bacterium]